MFAGLHFAYHADKKNHMQFKSTELLYVQYCADQAVQQMMQTAVTK